MNEEELLQSIDDSVFNENGTLKETAIKPIPRTTAHVFIGGNVDAASKDCSDSALVYVSACMQASPRHEHVILIDRSTLLINETKRLLELQTAGLSKDEQTVQIEDLTDDLYETLKDLHFSQREAVWVDWLADKCKMITSKPELQSYLEKAHNEITHLPQKLAQLTGTAASAIKIVEIRPLFKMFSDSIEAGESVAKTLESCFDERVIRALNPAGCADFARGLFVHENGGIYFDFDTLPSIKQELLDSVNCDLLAVESDNLGEELSPEFVILRHVFFKHPEWFTKSGSLNSAENQNSAQMSAHLDSIFKKHNIKSFDTLFERFEDISVSSDLFKTALDNVNVVASHPQSKAMRLWINQLIKNVHYQMQFNASFKEFIKDKGKKSESLADRIAERMIFLEDHFIKLYPLPVGSYVDKFKFAVATSVYDRLISGLKGGVTTTGPNVAEMIKINILGSERTEATNKAFQLEKEFSNDTPADRNSSWTKDTEYNEEALDYIEALTNLKRRQQQLEIRLEGCLQSLQELQSTSRQPSSSAYHSMPQELRQIDSQVHAIIKFIRELSKDLVNENGISWSIMRFDITQPHHEQYTAKLQMCEHKIENLEKRLASMVGIEQQINRKRKAEGEILAEMEKHTLEDDRASYPPDMTSQEVTAGDIDSVMSLHPSYIETLRKKTDAPSLSEKDIELLRGGKITFQDDCRGYFDNDKMILIYESKSKIKLVHVNSIPKNILSQTNQLLQRRETNPGQKITMQFDLISNEPKINAPKKSRH